MVILAATQQAVVGEAARRGGFGRVLGEVRICADAGSGERSKGGRKRWRTSDQRSHVRLGEEGAVDRELVSVHLE